MRRAEGYTVDAVNMDRSEHGKFGNVSRLLIDSDTLHGDSDDLVTSKDERNNDLYNTISSL